MLRYDSIWIIYNANGIFFNFAYYYRLIITLIGAEDLCKWNIVLIVGIMG